MADFVDTLGKTFRMAVANCGELPEEGEATIIRRHVFSNRTALFIGADCPYKPYYGCSSCFHWDKEPCQFHCAE